MAAILQLQKQMQALCGRLQNEVQALRDGEQQVDSHLLLTVEQKFEFSKQRLQVVEQVPKPQDELLKRVSGLLYVLIFHACVFGNRPSTATLRTSANFSIPSLRYKLFSHSLCIHT